MSHRQILPPPSNPPIRPRVSRHRAFIVEETVSISRQDPRVDPVEEKPATVRPGRRP